MQVILFAGGVFRHIASNLDIHTIITAGCNKVYFLCAVFTDVHIPSATAKFKVDDVFHHGRDGFGIKSKQAILESGISQIVLFQRLQDFFSLQIIAIATIDNSDDISLPERCEKQLSVFSSQPNLSICSASLQEFWEDKMLGQRIIPEKHEDIVNFSKKRNPFSHPVVMFRKSAVEKAGGYNEEYHLFEDYYLWIRMLMNGCKGYNIQEVLLNMRTPLDMYERRGGWQYTPGIRIIKTDTDLPQRLPQPLWETVDVLTCAAPNLRPVPYNRMNPGQGDAVEISDAELAQAKFHCSLSIESTFCEFSRVFMLGRITLNEEGPAMNSG